MSTSSRRTRSRVLEGYRVLTLQYPLPPDAGQLIEEYRVLASHLYWCARLSLKPAEEVIGKLEERIPTYWRNSLLSPKNPLYLFKGVEKVPRPYRTIIRLPLVDALHPNKGAYVKGGKLILRLGRRVELNIPARALGWLEKRLAEAPDAKKHVRVFKRDGKLIVQIVLRRSIEVEAPEDPLLVVVDVNSGYGIVVHFYCDGRLVKRVKLRPPNRGHKWKHVRELMSHRDQLYNQGCIKQRQINAYDALIRLTMRNMSMREWIKREAAKLVKRIRRMARRRGRQPAVVIDVPSDASLRHTPHQMTLVSFARCLENLLSWYGVYWEEARLYSTVCPRCGSDLELEARTKRTRVMRCPSCGFRDDRDNIPLWWAVKRWWGDAGLRTGVQPSEQQGSLPQG